MNNLLTEDKQQYFITTMNSYVSTNSLQRKGIEALRWLDKILVDDLDELESEIRDCIKPLNDANTRCKPLIVEFFKPNAEFHRGAYCGIKDLYSFYIYPVKAHFIKKEVSYQ